MILVSVSLAERLSQSEIGLPLRQICCYSHLKEVGVFSTEIKYEGHPMGVLGAPRIFVLKVHTTMIRDIFEEVCQPSVHHHHE